MEPSAFSMIMLGVRCRTRPERAAGGTLPRAGLSGSRRGSVVSAAAAGLCIAMLVGAGCGGGPPAEATGSAARAPGLEPIESVLVLTPGSMLVAPVEVHGSLPVGAVMVRVGGSGGDGADLR